MDIDKRIITLQATTGMNKKEFSERIGISQNTLYQQLSGQRGISLDVVSAILNAFPNVSAEWLLRNNGPMMLNGNSYDVKMGKMMDTIILLQDTIKENITTIKELQKKLEEK